MTIKEDTLRRFLEAQDTVMKQVSAELRAGRKTSHWMWFVFPQLRALGRSTTAQHFGLAGRDEALAYWRHPVLGARLAQCCELILALPEGSTAVDVFGSTDAMKLRSSMTLFAAADPEAGCFAAVLQKFFGGERDPLTTALLAA